MITHSRIDGRLIHGQVANLWTPSLGIERIIVIDDNAANNDVEKGGLRMAAPTTMRLSVLPVERAAKQILAGRYDSQKVFLVAKKPEWFLKLMEYGVPIETINVGNMSQNDKTKQVTNSINVDEHDIEVFDELNRRGVHLTAQMVPQAPASEFMELLEKVR